MNKSFFIFLSISCFHFIILGHVKASASTKLFFHLSLLFSFTSFPFFVFSYFLSQFLTSLLHFSTLLSYSSILLFFCFSFFLLFWQTFQTIKLIKFSFFKFHLFFSQCRLQQSCLVQLGLDYFNLNRWILALNIWLASHYKNMHVNHTMYIWSNIEFKQWIVTWI